MIPNNLKVGDLFTMDGHTFKVLGRDYEGRYTSQRVADATPSVEKITKAYVKVEEIKSEEITKADVNYDEMPIKDLQELCKKRGLAIRGTKADIIKRLQG